MSDNVAADPRTIWPSAAGDTLAPSRDQLIAWVREHSPRVRRAQAELAAADARSGYAGRWPDPELDGRVLSVDGELEVEGALLFTLPWNRAPGAAGRAAALERQQRSVALEAARFDAERELSRLLAAWQTAHVRAQVHEEVAARAAEYADLARQRREAGLADPLEVSLIMADAVGDRRAAVRGWEAVRAREGELRVLLNVDVPISCDTILPQNSDRPPDLDRLLAQADKTRPQWRQARLAYQQAEWEAARAGRERLPNPSVGPALTRNPERTSWGISAGIELPIFTNRGAAYREALAQRDGAYEELLAQRQRARSQIENLYNHIRALIEQLEATSGAPVDAAREALRLAEERYATGQIDVLLLLSAHRAYADLQLEVLNLRLAQHTARLELERAIGAGLEDVQISAGRSGGEQR